MKLCECGCGQEITKQAHHKRYGIPRFIRGHQNRGKNHPCYGKHHSKETKEKMRQKRLGSHHSKNTIEEMSKNRSGKNNAMYGKHHTKITKEKIRLAQIGHIISEETRLKLKKNRRYQFGEANSMWKGGITPLNFAIRNNNKYLKWRKQVFKKDKYLCQECKKKKNNNLQAHHIKSLSFLIKKYKIKTLRQAINCKGLWDIKNGITFCKKCHKKLHSELSLTTLRCR